MTTRPNAAPAPVRLDKLTNKPQTVDLGYGVGFTFRPPTYAALRAAEAAAFRLARNRIGEAAEAAVADAAAGEDAIVGYDDRITGLAEEIMLDGLVETCGEGWSGVADEDGETAAAFTLANWVRLRNGLPLVAQRLHHFIQHPTLVTVAEGNG